MILPTARDRVILDGLEYEVIGEPEDSTHGPWPMPWTLFPTPFTVAVRSYSEDDTTDEYGNPTETWSAPMSLRVCGWTSTAKGGEYGSEPKLAGHERVVVDVELLIPGYVVNLRKVEG